MSVRQKKIPIAALERIDDLCAEFEQGWQSDQPPTIESLLTAEDSKADDSATEVSSGEREILLAELVLLEIDYGRRRFTLKKSNFKTQAERAIVRP